MVYKYYVSKQLLAIILSALQAFNGLS